MLYFPNNTYFGFDQARDAYAVREILSGHLKIVGPPTANGILHHGVLYYYIFAPFYLLSRGDPVVVSLFLRILNAAGVFLLFLIVYPMFGEIAALISAFLFAISYEQTQFSLFLNHPSLAVISVLIFYLGLSYWIFKKNNWGLFLALFGLGLSIQFEFVETQLIPVFILFLLVFRKHLPKVSALNLLMGGLTFVLPLSTYIISEVSHNFFIVKQISDLIFLGQSQNTTAGSLSNFFFIITRHITDNLAASYLIAVILGLVLLIILVKLAFKGTYRKQLTFLILWFGGGLLVYFVINNDAYFYNTGTSISLLVFVAFLLSKLYAKRRLLIIPFLLLILFSNISLITKNNPLGPNEKINPQKGLLLTDEEKIIDFIYQDAKGKKFAVNALTMPYNVNTTWSYLFQWYGKRKYGYVPVWGGDAAAGFSGNLKVETARSKLPDKRFLIIEPQEGIPAYLAKSFLSSEENYAAIVGQKKIGTMIVLIQQSR
ncbi:MAG: glycosyltransferase family 39 protein [Actinobacteria bacterium]|nr:glycosyltransferase family 39 protein [Actinomycetota bacterium]